MMADPETLKTDTTSSQESTGQSEPPQPAAVPLPRVDEKKIEDPNPPTIPPPASNPFESDIDRFRDRVEAIEKRWGKKFEEVLVDIHDHIFGKSE